MLPVFFATLLGEPGDSTLHVGKIAYRTGQGCSGKAALGLSGVMVFLREAKGGIRVLPLRAGSSGIICRVLSLCRRLFKSTALALNRSARRRLGSG